MIQQRIYWIDNLKDFILLLVCFSHIGLFPEICNYLRGARMTTFFFLSGLLFSTRKYPTFSSYWRSKCHSLLIPYFILSFLFALFPLSLYAEKFFASNWIHQFHFSTSIEKYINTYIISTIDIIQGYSFTGTVVPLWFVYTLFQVSILYYLINKIQHKYLKLSFIIGSLCLGWLCNIYNITLAFHLSTTFTSLFFFALGSYSHKYIEKEDLKHNKAKYHKLIIFCFIYTLAYYNGGHLDLRLNNLGSSFIIYLLYTISGIFLFTTLFKLISNKDNIIFGIFRNISRNALIILCVHYFYMVLYDNLFPSSSFYKFIFVLIGTIISIPIFRCYLYRLIGKNKISFKESLSIK